MNLIIQQAALGDWVLTFPILRALAPQATVAVTSASKARLAARLLPHVHPHDIEQAGWSALFADRTPVAAGPTAELLRRARRAISFVSNDNDTWARNARLAAPDAEFFFVQPRPPQGWPTHVCDWHREQLSHQGLNLPEAAVAPGGNERGPIVIHPGSGGPAKCWAVDRWEALVVHLRSHGLDVRPILGEVEVDMWPPELKDRWVKERGEGVITGLDELADILQNARLFVGNDAGPTHLAAQMGLPTLALFGPSNATHWSPRGPKVTVLAPPKPRDMAWLTADMVIGACEAVIGGA